MTALLNNEGRIDQLATLLTTAGSYLRVGLFTSPTTNAKTNTLASYTAATFAGYSAQTATWSSPALDGNGNATYTGSTVTFTSTGASPTNVIYGYYLYQSGTGKVWYSELFSAPVTINASGQSITVQPTMYLGDCVPPL